VLDRMPDNFFAETEQVAFMTQNVPPGIDFTNDPLLQGRNFSYLDTQLKRLGGPNFTHMPINAPKCPFAHFQQDGHMAMRNPKSAARTTSRTPAARVRANPESAASAHTGRGDRAQGAAARRELRRPLQPGPPVLHQPDAARAGRTSRWP
jgi:catalase